MKAPEPDNIIWENLEFSKTKRYFRQNVTSLVSFVLLLVAFALVLGASGIQKTYAQIVPKITYCQSEVSFKRKKTTRNNIVKLRVSSKLILASCVCMMLTK